MELSKQVTSLELSKRLKELGVKQESVFAHICTRSFAAVSPVWTIWTSGASEEYMGDSHISAFTVAELGEMLPDYIKTNVGHLQSRLTKRLMKDSWIVEYVNRDENALQKFGQTEAEARGLMLAYLLENKLMSV